ncbi:hypothetical protein NDU88_001914 [Pleurodeles waltl]|uniref:Uncharacterized protein n=1 Tax=Pleurodeles waltl TaxID=8319 RepID=A0AAV7RCJ6_PLEWA|nr:hypothetical protein NDU88_001914 [Pleurodeles waltl]
MYRPHYYDTPIRHLFGVEPTLSKARRKQYTEGKTVTSPHPTRNQDAMEPELQILPMLVFLLFDQEHQRRRRRPR